MKGILFGMMAVPALTFGSCAADALIEEDVVQQDWELQVTSPIEHGDLRTATADVRFEDDRVYFDLDEEYAALTVEEAVKAGSLDAESAEIVQEILPPTYQVDFDYSFDGEHLYLTDTSNEHIVFNEPITLTPQDDGYMLSFDEEIKLPYALTEGFDFSVAEYLLVPVAK